MPPVLLADNFFQTFFDPDVLWKKFGELIREGIPNTIHFTLVSFIGALMIGLALALMRGSRRRWVRLPAAVYIDLFRGVPLLLVVIYIGFGLPIGWRDITGGPLRWPGGDIGSRFLPGCTALAIVAGAYLAETIRAGIEAVPRGQMEAARSLGMSQGSAMRKVVLPQAFRLNLAPLTNELCLLFKDTSLLTVLGVVAGGKEILKQSRDTLANDGPTVLTAAGLAYLAITIPLLRLAALLEAHGKRGTR
jgi:polar amino acid transport system permease protein